MATIKIYNGPGASKESLTHTYYTLKRHVAPKYTISYISPEEIIQGDWLYRTHLLVLPGGADVYYAKSLNGIGNDFIKAFIRKGGKFLGICAGSYYSGAYVEFAKLSNIEVVSPRELGFYNGIVRGPVLGDYYYNSDKGARAAKLTLMPNISQESSNACYIFYNGGGYFVNAENSLTTNVIAKYSAHDYAAIVQCKYGAGTALLSGVHIEYDPMIMKKKSLLTIINTLKKYEQERVILLHFVLKTLSVEHTQI